VETLLLLAVVAGGRATARSLCMQAASGGLTGMAAQFSDKSALEVCIHVMRYTNRRLCFYFFSVVNLRRRIGCNVASGAQCDILLNCAIEILVLN